MQRMYECINLLAQSIIIQTLNDFSWFWQANSDDYEENKTSFTRSIAA